MILVLFLLLVSGCSSSSVKPDVKQATVANQAAKDQLVESSYPSGQLKVHFLDVGQADSILVQFPSGQNMLIDAGNNSDGSTVVNYLKKVGVKKIDYLVGTHPHEDHIGGLDTVINNFEIINVYMPKVAHTTNTYKDVLEAVQAKGLKITPAKAGIEIARANGLAVDIIAPYKATYEELNNYSAVIKVTFGQVSFLFTGDSEMLSEEEMLASSTSDLKADVLKVGHHGSNSSTSPAFLKAVNPKYAIISVGTGNDYSHPSRDTLGRLHGIKTYRTDLNGTVIFISDGKELQVTSEKNQSSVINSDMSSTGFDEKGKGPIKGNINSKGEKIYHMPGGAYYDKTNPERWFKTEEDAQTAGFRASKR